MSFSNSYRFEVVFTGLCILVLDGKNFKNPRVLMVKSPPKHEHLPLLTYRLDTYIKPKESKPSKVVSDASGNLLGQIPLEKRIRIGVVGAKKTSALVAESSQLGRPEELLLSFSSSCRLDGEDMGLDLSKIGKFLTHEIHFRGGQILFRKPVTAPLGDVLLWERKSEDFSLFAEQIVWRHEANKLLRIQMDDGHSKRFYDFGRTSYVPLALTNLPSSVIPASHTNNFEHWRHFAMMVKQKISIPKQYGGGTSHSSSSCPPTSGVL